MQEVKPKAKQYSFSQLQAYRNMCKDYANRLFTSDSNSFTRLLSFSQL
jgi:hypothetical protein